MTRRGWRAPDAAALLLAGCAASSLAGCAGGSGAGPSGRFIGQVSPVPAVPGARCGAPTRAVLDVQDGRFVFAPNEGVLVINGTAAPDGALQGSLPLHGGAAPRDKTPGDKTTGGATVPEVLAFSGRVDGDQVDGTLREPRCTATVSLRRR